jgi:hypothetical protein
MAYICVHNFGNCESMNVKTHFLLQHWYHTIYRLTFICGVDSTRVLYWEILGEYLKPKTAYHNKLFCSFPQRLID